MSSKPSSPGKLLIELINVKWNDEYDNKQAIWAANYALEDEPEVDKRWLREKLDQFEQKDSPKSWRDFREFVIQSQFREKTSDDFIENFETYYKKQPWRDD